MQMSFRLDTFQTLSGHNVSPDSPDLYVSGCVSTAGSRDCLYPIPRKVSSILSMEEIGKHISTPHTPTSRHPQFNIPSIKHQPLDMTGNNVERDHVRGPCVLSACSQLVVPFWEDLGLWWGQAGGNRRRPLKVVACL